MRRRYDERMRRLALCLALLALLLAACGGGEEGEPTSTATSRPTRTPTHTPTKVPTSTPTLTPVPQPTQEPTQPLTGHAEVLRRGDPATNAVVLTFDAGSDTGFATQILDTLEAEHITAAFGITGQWADRNPGLIRRIVAEGHQLINHSYDHASFTGLSTRNLPLSQQQRWAEVDRTEEIVQQIAGASTKPYFRPPYGDYDDSVNADVFARGYTYNVMWTVDSQGWNGLSADEIVQRCLSQAQAGAIYIFHVGSASQDAAALQRVIDGLRATGYGFVPLSAFAPP